MARLQPIAPDELDNAQKEVAGIRPERMATGPFTVWLRRPELAAIISQLMRYMRRGGLTLEPRLTELAILVAARAWTAQFAWYAHEPQAVENGIKQDVIEAIRHRRTPQFDKPDEAVVYALTSELAANQKVSDGTYAEALAILGEGKLVDLVNLFGFYMMIATNLVTFEVEIPTENLPGGNLPLPE